MIALADTEPLIVAGWLLLGFLIFALGMIRRTEDVEKSKTLVIVDDDPDVRRGLKSLIESRTPFSVVGEAHTGKMAVHVVDSLDPDLVVVDVKLPDIDGLEVTRRLRMIDPALPVIGFSAVEDDATGEIMRRAGAAAHFVKGDPPEHIVETILRFA
jgi:two-component system invasion response regulator UvrY